MHQDFLDRVDILGALGATVLISNYGEYLPPGRLSLASHPQADRHRDGRADLARDFRREILRRPGRRDPRVVRAAVQKRPQALRLPLARSLHRLAHHCRQPAGRPAPAGTSTTTSIENRLIESIRDYDQDCLPIFSRDVLNRMRSGDPGWESMVPPVVAEIIKRRKLLGYVERTRARRGTNPATGGLVDSINLAGMTKSGAKRSRVH